VPILIDGNNLLHHLPAGQRSRAAVRRRALDSVRHESVSVTVVFDGPPPAGSPSSESLGRVTVVYSGDRTADDVIIRMIPTGASARQWSVVTDDRGLADRARARGATVRRLAEWRSRREPAPRRASFEPKLSSHEVAEWEDFFADRPEGGGE
jgi:hypothetical protein